MKKNEQSLPELRCVRLDERLPARSRLASLEPVGMGTVRTEGLVSYLIRLAGAHSVNPRRLIRMEFMGAHPGTARLNGFAFFQNYARTVDSLGWYANLFCSAATALTGRQDLHLLTLLPLQRLLPRIGEGTISRNLRWCPDCFADMARSGQESYRPLAWSLSLYRYCSTHRRPLVERCPHCHEVQHIIPNYPSVCHCSRCGAWLGQSQGGDSASADDLWISAAIEDVILNLRRLGDEGSMENLVKAIEIAAQRTTAGIRKPLCERIGLGKTVLRSWSRGRQPTFPRWLAVAYVLDTMPSALLLPARVDDLAPPGLRHAPDTLSVRRAPKALSDAERRHIADELREAAEDPNDHRSLSSIARGYGWYTPGLRRIAPEHCDRICEKYSRHRKLAAEQNHAKICEKLYQAMEELVRNGDYPGGQKLKRMLSQQGLVLIPPYLLKAYRDALANWARGELPGKDGAT